ncbi:23795_t:CDS:2, partial [Racocetra persica]
EVEQDERKIFECYYEAANLNDVIGMSQVAHYFRGRKRFKKIEHLVLKDKKALF